MICGFCGITKTDIVKKNSLNFHYSNNKKENLVYLKCSNKIDEKINKIEENFEQVAYLKKIVNNQILSIENIENYILHKKKLFLIEINSYLKNKKDEFERNKMVLSEFEINFEKLKNIKIEKKYEKIFKDKLQDYFNKEELEEWVFYCEKKITQILRKINRVKEEFEKETEFFIKNLENSKNEKDINRIKNKIDLHDMSFMILQNKKKNDDKNNNKLETLKIFYTKTHKNNLLYLKNRFKNIKISINSLNKKFERNKILLDDIFINFKKDFRFINIFENFQFVFQKCLKEIDYRTKFKFIYKRLLEFLNELSIKENKRRLIFLNEFSSKIPDQIFPYLKSLCKQINLTKFFYSFDDNISYDENEMEMVLKKLEHIKTLLKEL